MTVVNRLPLPGRTRAFATADADQPTLLCVNGDLDTQSAAELRTALRAVARLRLVLVDLSDVGFIDSVGLGVLIGGIRDLHEHGGRIVVVARPGPTRDLLDRVGVTSLVPVFPALGAANYH